MASALLGLAVGTGVNALSNDVGYPGAAAAFAAAAVLAATGWLRRLPGSPLVRWTTRVLLSASILAVVFSVLPAVLPGRHPSSRYVGGMVLAAATLGTVAALMQQGDQAWRIAVSVAFVGMGVWLGALGVRSLQLGVENPDGWDSAPNALVVVSIGMGVIWLGISLLSREARPVGAASVAAGLTFAGFAVLPLRMGESLLAVWFAVAGLSIVGLGTALIRSADELPGVMLMGTGASLSD